MLIIFLILFFLLQILVLFCCLAAGNDPASQELSDREQTSYFSGVPVKISIVSELPELIPSRFRTVFTV